jgi:hypothetical protein
MDPWLEHPALWPDFHNRFIAAIADDLSPRLAPRYFVGVENHAYLIRPSDRGFLVPDRMIVAKPPHEVSAGIVPREVSSSVDVLEVVVPVAEDIKAYYLKIREAQSGKLVTLLELLSPVNKLHRKGRAK